jgi:hypothetical protein
VLDVAGDAERGVELLQAIGVARVGELLLRVGIVRFLQLRGVAALAGLLQRLPAAEGRAVAALAGELDLVVAVRGLARQQERAPRCEQRAARRRRVEERRPQVPQNRQTQRAPEDPQCAVQK